MRRASEHGERVEPGNGRGARAMANVQSRTKSHDRRRLPLRPFPCRRPSTVWLCSPARVAARVAAAVGADGGASVVHASPTHPLLRPPVSAHSPQDTANLATGVRAPAPRGARRTRRAIEASAVCRRRGADPRAVCRPACCGGGVRPAGGGHTGGVPRMAARERGWWPARRAQQRWCDMRRTAKSFTLAIVGVISGRTSASGRLYVLISRRGSWRLICSRG